MGELQNLQTFLPLIAIVIFFYFFVIRPQRKKEKEIKDMRDSLKAGDEIITIGGICGKIVKVKEETIVVQVGADRLKFEMMRWSVSKIVGNDAKAKKGVPAEEPEEPKKKSLPKKLGKKEDSNAETTENPVVSEQITEDKTEE